MQQLVLRAPAHRPRRLALTCAGTRYEPAMYRRVIYNKGTVVLAGAIRSKG